MKILNNYKGLPRSIYFLFIVQVVNRLGDFVFPFLSLLLTQKLQFSTAKAGSIIMIASLVGIPASFIGGKFADKISRKKTYIVGQGLAAISILICGFIKTPTVIVVLLIASAFFNGFVRPSMSAMVADLLPAEKRQIGSSLLYLGINFGVALGPIIAGFLFNNYLSLLFIGDALTSFIAVSIVCIFVEDTQPLKIIGKARIEEKEEEGNIVEILLKRPFIVCFFAIDIIYAVIYRQSLFSLPIMMTKVFGYGGSSKYGFLMSVNAITVVTLTVFIMQFIRKLRTLTNMAIVGAFYALGFGMICIIGRNYMFFIISTIVWSIGEIIASTNFGVYVANNSPRNCRARFGAVGEIVSSAGAALGTFVAGKYIDIYGINTVWMAIFVLALIGGALMLVLQYFQMAAGS